MYRCLTVNSGGYFVDMRVFSIAKCGPTHLSLDRDAFGQVSWLIDVTFEGESGVVGE